MAAYRLEVDAAELCATLKGLKRFAKGMKGKSVLLSHNEGNLALATPGVAVTLPAKGHWPTPVRATAHILVMLIKVPPLGDGPFVISFDGKRLSIAECSVQASIEEEFLPRVDVLPTKRFFDLLRMGATWSYKDLQKEGFIEQVWRAEEKRDRLLAKAAETLSRLGIDRKDMNELLNAKLKSQTTKHVKGPEAERNDLLAVAARILSPLNIDRADLVELYNAKRKRGTPEGPKNRET